MPGLYEYFVAKNEELVDLLTLYGFDKEKIEIVEPARSWRSGKLGSTVLAKKVTYQKRTITKLNTNNLSVVNKNGQYHTTVWTTTPDGIKTALRMGIFSPKRLESPIAKLIACYGQYKKLVFQRKEERGLVSSKNKSKLEIVDFAQDAIAQLQPIYECINRYDASKNSDENLKMILDELQNLDNQLKVMCISNNANDIFKKGIAKNQAALAQFKKKLSSYEGKKRFYIEAIMRPTGLFCLGNFLQEQLETINETARKANNAISGLYNRGELFDAIHEAEVVCRQMPESPDYHNPAPRELSLCFGDMKEQKDVSQSVVLDLNKQGAAVADHSELVLQLKLLAQIEERHKADADADIETELKNFQRNESSFGMFWSHWTSRSIATMLAGFIVTLLLCIVTAVLFLFDVLAALPGVYSISHLLGYGYDPQTSFYPSEWAKKRILAWLNWGATDNVVLGNPPVSSIEQRAFIS